MRTCSRSSPPRSYSAAARASACDREPGLSTISRRPSRANSLRRATANAVAGDSLLGLFIVQSFKLRFKPADARLLRFEPVRVSQEGRVVIGCQRSGIPCPLCRTIAAALLADRQPQDRADDGDEDDDEDPRDLVEGLDPRVVNRDHVNEAKDEQGEFDESNNEIEAHHASNCKLAARSNADDLNWSGAPLDQVLADSTDDLRGCTRGAPDLRHQSV